MVKRVRTISWECNYEWCSLVPVPYVFTHKKRSGGGGNRTTNDEDMYPVNIFKLLHETNKVDLFFTNEFTLC